MTVFRASGSKRVVALGARKLVGTGGKRRRKIEPKLAFQLMLWDQQ